MSVDTTMTDPARVIPDVWGLPSSGIGWCDCGEHHQLTREVVALNVAAACGGLPVRITHRRVVQAAARLWRYESVCRFFTMAVEDAAKRVNGQIDDTYPVEVGLAIVKDFSDRWAGCPAEVCGGPTNRVTARGRSTARQ
jgi:hypothetical protein